MTEGTQKVDYTAVLSDLKRQLADIEAEKQSLEAKRVTLQAALDSIQAVIGVSEPTTPAPALLPTSTPPEEKPLTTGVLIANINEFSIAGAVQQYLHLVKKPQTIREIANALRISGFETQSENFINTLSTTLSTGMRKYGTFARFEDNKWGLPEWQNVTTSQQ